MPISRPMSLATNVSVELGGYQVALEDVLTWLLEAEDKLSHAPEPGPTLDILKQQFHEHETFLMELSGHQDGVGAVLEEGARLLADGGLHKDEEDEVRVQMQLLNSRWEGLRTHAMERQSRIHEVKHETCSTRLSPITILSLHSGSDGEATSAVGLPAQMVDRNGGSNIPHVCFRAE